MSSDGLPNVEPCSSPLGQLVDLPGAGCWLEVLLWDNSANQTWKHRQPPALSLPGPCSCDAVPRGRPDSYLEEFQAGMCCWAALRGAGRPLRGLGGLGFFRPLLIFPSSSLPPPLLPQTSPSDCTQQDHRCAFSPLPGYQERAGLVQQGPPSWRRKGWQV